MNIAIKLAILGVAALSASCRPSRLGKDARSKLPLPDPSAALATVYVGAVGDQAQAEFAPFMVEGRFFGVSTELVKTGDWWTDVMLYLKGPTLLVEECTLDGFDGRHLDQSNSPFA